MTRVAISTGVISHRESRRCGYPVHCEQDEETLEMPAEARGKVRQDAAAEMFDWEPFIGRCLALLCLHQGDVSDKPLVERAEYLMRLGLPRREAALVLGSTDDSLRVMLSTR